MKWAVIVIAITMLPGMTYAAFLQFRGHKLYKRQTRGPLYLVGWLSVLVCLGVVVSFQCTAYFGGLCRHARSLAAFTVGSQPLGHEGVGTCSRRNRMLCSTYPAWEGGQRADWLDTLGLCNHHALGKGGYTKSHNSTGSPWRSRRSVTSDCCFSSSACLTF